tara:strand:+ start:137 stop:547 length:411 start_codon:yes stop_codon:yes gene_type:complete
MRSLRNKLIGQIITADDLAYRLDERSIDCKEVDVLPLRKDKVVYSFLSAEDGTKKENYVQSNYSFLVNSVEDPLLLFKRKFKGSVNWGLSFPLDDKPYFNRLDSFYKNLMEEIDEAGLKIRQVHSPEFDFNYSKGL